MSYLDPKLAQNIKKLVCICRRGQKMCFKNGKFQKVYLRNRGGPGYAHIAKKIFFLKVSPKGLIITNQLENLCAMLKNSLNQVSKLAKIPIFPYIIYRKLCNVAVVKLGQKSHSNQWLLVGWDQNLYLLAKWHLECH